MSQKTTGEVIADSLVAHGVDTVFCIPGAHMYDFNDALQRRGNSIRTIHTRHEQGAGYMAYGYAKSTGRPGVYSVVPGPGVLNSGAALCTAYGANAPVMCITGNIMTHLLGQGRGQLHELPDQLSTLKGLTKHAARINHQAQAADTMADAFRAMQSDRPGPVAVETPWDIFGMRGPEPVLEARLLRKTPVNPTQIKEAAALIAAAKNPLIMVGGGAYDAADEVMALAKKIQAPVTSHRGGKGVVPGDSPYAMDLAAGYAFWKDCDLLIGIGSRLELQFMRWRWKPTGLKTIRIDIDPTEMVRLKPDCPVVADAAEATQALIGAVDQAETNREDEFAKISADARIDYDSVQPQMAYVDAMRAALPRDGIFVEEVSQMGFTARFGFPVYKPRQYITCGYQDNLGFGYNTALGVKIANPDKPVISISGDGGFMFGVQELATAVQFKINVIAIVFNNSAYGNVLRDQNTVYEGRVLGSELENPDFVALAQSFGMEACKTETPEALKAAIEDYLARDIPALIEVPVETGSETSPWTFLHPAPHE
ncbi:MAG: thiamine pyrophosphate-dependent enzyme [Pseudomonadota bacterium]